MRSLPWKTLLPLAVAVALGLAAQPGQARTTVVIGAPPPAPRVEVVPPPRVGYAWQPGYWSWNGAQYVWVPGAYVAAPYPRAVWVPGGWRPRRGGWVWVEGHWRR